MLKENDSLIEKTGDREHVSLALSCLLPGPGGQEGGTYTVLRAGTVGPSPNWVILDGLGSWGPASQAPCLLPVAPEASIHANVAGEL